MKKLFVFFIAGIAISAIARESLPSNFDNEVVYVSDGADLSKLLTQDDTRFVIRHSHNLDGKNIVVGSNSVLDFQGGRICDGRIVGNGCLIEGSLLFDHVNFSNSCKIDYITDSFISIVDEENLVDLFSLLNDEEYQVLEISKNYVTSTIAEQGHNYLNLMSHSKIIINGSISLGTTLQNVTAYRVLLAMDKDDIEICGGGALVGDRDSKRFVGTETYEHGVGIGIYNSTNVFIHGITIAKMIGDGIYITSTGNKHAENILITNTRLLYNRRQGISLIAGNNITIKNNYIGYTGGTQPEAAFDLEPNQPYQTSRNVFFCENILENNNDGIHIHDKRAPAYNVVIENNTVCSRVPDKEKRNGFTQYGGCNVIITNSGGSIHIRNQEMINLVVYKNTGNIRVDSCSIHQSLGFINSEDCSGNLSLNDCILERRIELKQTWYSTVIYTRRGAGELTNAEFNRCKLSSGTVGLFNTISVKKDQISKFIFNDCEIDINGALLCRANSSYKRCNINCNRMKISLPSTKFNLVMEDNIISFNGGTRATPMIYIDDVSSQFEGDYNIIMRNNSFTQHLGQEIIRVGRGVNKGNLRLLFLNNSAPDSSGRQTILPKEINGSI